MSRKLSPEVKRFALTLLGSIGTPSADRISDAIHREDWVYVAKQRVDPRAYNNALEYFLDAQASALLRKLEDLPTPADSRRVKALENWRKGEADCYRTNERLSPYLEGVTHPSCDPAVLRHIGGMQKIVKSILGRCPSMDDLLGKFGPGATFSDPSVRSTIADKMNVNASITRGAKWFILPWMATTWGRLTADSVPRRGLVEVRGNRFAVAPKDAEKGRAIGAEPSVNIFFQLPVGKAIRARLRRVGIDLDGGQSKHRQVACEASITGRFATLDLSNASDTVARSFVKLMLPPDWYELLTELRSPSTRFLSKDLPAKPTVPDGVDSSKRWVLLEKFSSMGNGFTFELESLLFYAVVKYIEMMYIDDDTGQTLVYGDDIICNTEIVPAVTQALQFFGFSLNTEKSFSEGKFRESCGGDYFDGQAVRPYFLKESLCEPQQFIACANGVRRAFEESPVGFTLARRAWFYLLDQLPIGIRRCRGPQGLGDIVIHDERDRWRTRWRSQTMYVQVYRPAKHLGVSWNRFDPDVVLACALYGSAWNRGFIRPRDSVAGYKVGWITAYGIPWVPQVGVVSEGNSLVDYLLKRSTLDFPEDY